MQLRLIELVLPQSSADEIEQLPDDQTILGRWDDLLDDGKLQVRMLVDIKSTESLLDKLESRFHHLDDFRVMLFPVEATLPRPKKPESQEEAEAPKEKSPQRVSREEMYNDVSESAAITTVFIAQVIIATLVAAIGLLRGDTAVLIGAMVIAPLLGPNVSLSLGTVLGDLELIWRSLKTNAVGLTVALLVALLIGAILPIDPTSDAIAQRTHVSTGDIILALAAGCAGVLAFTTGVPSALIGVMVAVALLPPFAVFGLLLASGEFQPAGGALMLTATNVICVNLAGVLTFFAQGVRPRTWWETKRARTATRIALLIWATLLAILIGIVIWIARLS
jgi:uncharacterized hydrophobic protein (TIGR00341 family)